MIVTSVYYLFKFIICDEFGILPIRFTYFYYQKLKRQKIFCTLLEVLNGFCSVRE